MGILPIALALMAGFCTAIENTINGRLTTHISAGAATLFNLALGAVLMLLVNILNGNISQYKNIASVNPLLLTGGFFGAMIIYLSSKAIPSLGVTNTLVLIIAGQLAVGIISDVLLKTTHIDAVKLIGITLVAAGAYIIIKRQP